MKIKKIQKGNLPLNVKLYKGENELNMMFIDSDGTYLYLDLGDRKPNILDNKYKADNKFWTKLFVCINPYKVLI